MNDLPTVLSIHSRLTVGGGFPFREILHCYCLPRAAITIIVLVGFRLKKVLSCKTTMMDREELKLYTGPYTGGLTMTSEMLSILKQPVKYLHSRQDGGQKLRELYQDGQYMRYIQAQKSQDLIHFIEATNWSARKLSMFGLACYFGELEAVISVSRVILCPYF